jgi:hypothetical protein
MGTLCAKSYDGLRPIATASPINSCRMGDMKNMSPAATGFA